MFFELSFPRGDAQQGPLPFPTAQHITKVKNIKDVESINNKDESQNDLPKPITQVTNPCLWRNQAPKQRLKVS